jgi:hypothetical protein
MGLQDRVQDRLDIMEVMSRYGWATDTKDFELLDRVFAPDAVATYEGFSEPTKGLDAIREFGRRALEPLDGTQHLFTNFAIEFESEDEARLRVCHQAQHINHRALDGPLYTVAGTYHIRVRRMSGTWLITELNYSTVWTSGNPAVLDHIAL